MALFNTDNTAHKTGEYPIFLGQPMGLYDSVTQVYPSLMDLYQKQKAQDWSHDEFDFTQSRQDFKTCPPSVHDIALETIMWQWEADSVAAQSIFALLSPFITNSEAFAMIQKQSEIEVTHALTYSEIIRNCNPAPREVIAKIMNNQDVLKRTDSIVRYMRDLEVLGAHYRLDKDSVDPEVARRTILRALFALLGLEGIEFIASFACTFALAEQQWFMGVAQAVQKIMLDEMLHTQMDLEIVTILLKDDDWRESFEAIKGELKEILDEVISQEKAWSEYIFSDGRAIVGLNENLLMEWVHWNSAPLYDFFQIKRDFSTPSRDPLPWMYTWMNPGSQQNANQEQTNGDYQLNSTKDDAKGIELDF